MSARITSHDAEYSSRRPEPEAHHPAAAAAALAAMKFRFVPKEATLAAFHPAPGLFAPSNERSTDRRFLSELIYVAHFTLLLLIQHFNLNELNFYRYNTAFIHMAVFLLLRRVFWTYFQSRHLVRWSDLLRPSGLLFATIFVAYVSWFTTSLGLLLAGHSFGDVLSIFYPYVLEYCLFGSSAIAIERAKLVPSASPVKPHAVFIYLKYTICKCLFYTFETTYLTAVLPLRFQKNDHVFYEPFDLLSFVGFALINALVIAVLELYASQHKTLLASASAIGDWAPLNRNTGGTIWSPTTSYSKGAIVRFKKKVFQALHSPTTAPPNRFWVSALNSMSRSPLPVLNTLVTIECLVVLLIFIVVIVSPRWHLATAWGLFALSNYVLLWQIFLIRRALCPRRAKKK